MRRLLLLFITILGAVALTACSGAKAYDFESETITVGLECGYAPYNWTVSASEKSEHSVKIDGTNQYCDGYDIQIASHVADELGKELVVKKLAWDGLIPSLNSNSIDMIIAGMSPTEERKESISFSNSYFTEDMEMVVVVKKDSSYANGQNLDSFSGATVAAQMGTFHTDLLSQLDGAKHHTTYKSFPDLINALKSSSIDAYLSERTVAESHLEANSDFSLISFTDLENATFKLADEYTSTAIGLRKVDSELQTKINEALAKLDNDTRNAWMDSASERQAE